MITPEYCVLMARYAGWMNARLHGMLAGVPDDERRRDRGAFFGSMHETCNHLLWGDRTWLSRFMSVPYAVGGFGRGLFDDFDMLVRERAATDEAMLEWARGLDAHALDGLLTYTSAIDGRTRTLPRAKAVVHFFNHGTHHRGQLTTLMVQAGLDPGVTDLPFLPEAA